MFPFHSGCSSASPVEPGVSFTRDCCATCGGQSNVIREGAYHIASYLSLSKHSQHLLLVRKLHSYTQIFAALGYFLSEVPRIVSCIAMTIGFAARWRKLRIFLDGFQSQVLTVDIFYLFLLKLEGTWQRCACEEGQSWWMFLCALQHFWYRRLLVF